MTHFVLGYSFTRAERSPSSMYTQLAAPSSMYTQLASKCASNTIAPSFFEEAKKFLSRLKRQHISYVRDILYLASGWCSGSQISIPRGDRRSCLTENGLLGKIVFSSVMSSKEIILEISRKVASQMGLSKSARHI